MTQSGDRRRLTGSELGPVFHAAIDGCSSAVVVCDDRGRFLYVNDAACELLGYSREEYLTFDVSRIVAPSEVPRVQREFAEAMANGRFMGDYETVRSDGATRWCRVDASCADGVHLLAFVTDITDQVESRAEIARREGELRAIFDSAQDMIFLKDRDLRYTHLNQAALDYLGMPAHEIVGRTDQEIFERERAGEIEAVDRRVLAGHEDKTLVARGQGEQRRILETIKVPVRDEAGQVVGLCGVTRDLTEVRAMEEQLRQAQKLEAVGRLAAGVAHDFNNLLTPILGYADLLASTLADDAQAQRDLAAIVRAGARARDLTANLLAFSRKQVLDKKPTSLNDVVEATRPMLERLVREDVTIRLRLQDGLGAVRADRGQLQNVLINLTVNSADAMPDGGILTIETQDVRLGSEYVKLHPGAVEGPYVLLAISDTGLGMDEETRRRAFEPFFTTKAVDEGTGLGLATVHGIVKQHGGGIEVYSEPEHGCTVKIYLPLHDGVVSEAEIEAEADRLAGDEHIMLVEDDAAVRQLTEAVLERYGYTVTALSSPAEATRMAAEIVPPPHLLLSDVVMPGMNGAQLHRVLRGTWPELPVLFMSGYTSNIIAHHGVLPEGQRFLQKPFQPVDLLHKIREVLDGQPDSAP